MPQLHTNEPISEADFFEKSGLYEVGQVGQVSGAVSAGGRILIASAIERTGEGELELRCMDPQGGATVLKARSRNAQVFATSASLVW